MTQQFNTTTSMGKLTLNILLSFAQFERELIGERVRDKVALARRRGKSTGGTPILGYDLVNSKLVINPKEAKTVRHIFSRFLEIGSATLLAKELREQGVEKKSWVTNKGRKRTSGLIEEGYIYRMINNRKYIGDVGHKGQWYPGEHDAIIDPATWGKVQTILKQNNLQRANQPRRRIPAMLKGIIRCGACESAMGQTYSKKGGTQYRYYQCAKSAKMVVDPCPSARSLPGLPRTRW